MAPPVPCQPGPSCDPCRSAGCDNVVEVQDVGTGTALQAAIDGGKGTVMIVKCDSGNAKMPVITMDPVIIRDRFMKAVEA